MRVRNTPILPVVLGALALVGTPLAAQELTLADVIEAALEESIELEQARLRTALAESSVEAVVDSTRPALSLAADPLASLVTQRGSDFAAATNPADFPPDPVTSLIASTGGALSYRQPLPTGGLLSSSAGATFTATTAFPDSGDPSTTFSLSPSLSLALTQPLFVDGRFVDTEEPMLVLEQARRGVAESRAGETAVRRQTVDAAIRLYAQLGTLRRASALQETQERLLELQLEQARIRQEQGQGSRAELFALEVQITRTREAIVQTALSAREAELELGRIIGRPIDSTVALADLAGPAALLADAIDAAGAEPAPTLEEEQAARALERAQTDLSLAEKQERATGSLSLALSPRYADERESSDTPGGAVTDYFGDGSGVDVSVALGLTVPLGEGARRSREIRQAGLAVESAEAELERITTRTETQRAIVRARREATLERIRLLEFELEFDREQLASELELAELGATTELAVEQLRAGIEQRRNELEDLATQLFLQQVDLARLSGIDPAALLLGRP